MLEIGRQFRAADAIEIARAGNEQFADLAEAAQYEIAVIGELAAHAQGNIDAIVYDIHAPVADLHLHAHQGETSQEFRQQARDAFLQQGRRATDLDQAARFRAEPIHDFARRLRLGEHGLRVAIHALANVRHGELAGRTLQQTHAQIFFQLRDAPAQAGFRDTECALGGRVAAMFDHVGEKLQVVQILHGRVLSDPIVAIMEL